MIHKNRTWGEPCTALELAARRGETFAGEAEALAHYLTEWTWTTCTAWRFGKLLLVSDAFGGDGAQEYAVLQPIEFEGRSYFRQIESITFSWCTTEKALEYLTQLADGTLGEAFGAPLTPRFHPKGETCRGCA